MAEQHENAIVKVLRSISVLVGIASLFRQSGSSVDTDPRGPDWSSCPQLSYDVTKRLRLGAHGATVYGWPSTGGMLLREPNAVELEYLGIDRFHDSERSEDPAEEDVFCTRMGNVGASWWQSEGDWVDAILGEREMSEQESIRLEVGWPEAGGVWILKYSIRNKPPPKIGKVKMALNMEERCQMIEGLGGKFYASSLECSDLANSYPLVRREI